MEGASIDPTNEKLKQLKQLFPEAFTEGNVDWEKLKATLGEDINFANERYVLNWAGKSNAFKEIKTPTTKTLIPCKEESEDWDNTEHIFIEGENLDVLRTLQKSYHNKIKMIYIDPPYNTGNDSFVYPDKFSETKDEYQKRVGDKDEEGYLVNDCHFSTNSKENGQYHSNWLNMMYPRLHLAKNLLKEDGVIFVSIDDNEAHNLQLMLNEIFGEENFVSKVTRATGTPTGGGGAKAVVNELDYLLIYSKSQELNFQGLKLTKEESSIYDKQDKLGRYLIRPLRRTGGEDRREDRPTMFYPLLSPDDTEIYPISPTGYESRWICGIDKYNKLKNDNLIEWKKNEDGKWSVYQKFYLEGRLKQPGNLWDEVEGNKKATRDVRNLFDGIKLFDFPKPIGFISKILKISTLENDIVLDFFSGSGSTAHSVMALNVEDGGNRKCISVQLAEPTDEKSEAFKAGYKNIADISKERIKRAAKKIKKDNPLFSGDLGMKVFKLQESNFKQWRQLNTTDAAELAKQIKMFVDPVSADAINEDMLYELLLKSGKDLNSSIVLKDKVYYINDNELVILLDEVSQDIIDSVISQKPNKVRVLDKIFGGNDKLKTNTKLQMDDAGIEFKTI